jgi:hypothetical protein
MCMRLPSLHELHSNLTSGQLTCEDLPVRGAPVCSQTPDEQQEVTSPAPSLRLSSRPDSSDYFDDSRATVSRFPAPPTVRVGSENIMSHRQQCRIPHYSDARPGSRRFPALPTTLSNTALGRGDLREASMGKACYLTEYPLSALRSRSSCENSRPLADFTFPQVCSGLRGLSLLQRKKYLVQDAAFY